MIAALMGSRRPGRTAWIFKRHAKTLHVRGIAGDKVTIFMRGGEDCQISFIEDAEFLIPEKCTLLMVDHEVSSGNRVYVDLR